MTELLWEGKYDPDGRRVAPLQVALPFQTVETVNESTVERQRTLDLFTAGRDAEWRNRLIWGDNKYVLPALLEEFSGRVRMVYIDPPFASGQDFSYTRDIPESEQSFIKTASVIEQKAYRDTWGRGLSSYLQMLYERLVLIHELLRPDGTLFLHLGSNVSHYGKMLCDEIFGRDAFINEITWKRSDAHSDYGQGAKHLGRIHDAILFYAKGSGYVFRPKYTPLPEETADRWYKHVEPETGRRYNLADITGPGGASKGNPHYEFLGVTRYWRYSRERMQELYEQGRIVQRNPGTVPAQKRYLDESKGVALQDIWTDISMLRGFTAGERIGYDTQKPEELLARIIDLASEPGDLVADLFLGSGTTAVAAEKLGRRWIGCDLGRFAIQTTRKRLLSVPDVSPFIVQNLGKYERQLWQAAEFGDEAQPRTHAYRRFILAAYKAKPIEGYAWLHGIKQGRLVHVGTVDAPVTVGDVKQIATEFGRAMGTGEDAPTSKSVDVLGWDFAFEMNEVARQSADRAGIEVHFWKIRAGSPEG